MVTYSQAFTDTLTTSLPGIDFQQSASALLTCSVIVRKEAVAISDGNVLFRGNPSPHFDRCEMNDEVGSPDHCLWKKNLEFVSSLTLPAGTPLNAL